MRKIHPEPTRFLIESDPSLTLRAWGRDRRTEDMLEETSGFGARMRTTILEIESRRDG